MTISSRFMSYVYHTLKPKAHKSPSSLQAGVPNSLKWGAFNLSMAAEEHAAAHCFHLSSAGGGLDQSSCVGGCLDRFSCTGDHPSGAWGCSDLLLHLGTPAVSNPWALKHSQNGSLYTTNLKSLFFRTQHDHNSVGQPHGVKDFPFTGSYNGIPSLMPSPSHCSTEPFKTRDKEQ